MTKEEFRCIYMKALDAAVNDVKARCHCSVISPKIFIELHGAGSAGDMIDIDQAFDRIFISDSEFYKIVDLAVKKCESEKTVVFMRISDHGLGKFDQTWSPDDFGPFKILEADCSSLKN